MKLTKAHLDEFSRAVIKSLPLKNTFNRGALTEALNARTYAALPEAVKAFKKQYPSIVGTHNTCIRIEHPHWPLGALSPNCNTRDYVYYDTWALPELEALNFDDLIAQYHAHLDELAERDAMRQELREKAGTCRTLEQLQKLFPELVEWMPKEPRYAVALVSPDTAMVNKLKEAGLELATA